ncbi:MAG TPA: GAF domain-containing sensor histidine kinase [Candidatus Binataceae bacterium]|nr:GAF domain-containing sensor histidine kinase [Candidatus Binataceae bacterium]
MREPSCRPENLWVYQQRQHTVLKSLGEVIRADGGLAGLLDQAPALVIQALGVEFCQILEYSMDRRHLLPRGRAGWRDGAFGPGDPGLEAGIGSFGGFTLISRRPVTFENLAEERRFRPSGALVDHQVVSGTGVPIGDDSPFGVLCAFSNRRRRFDQDEIAFLRSVADIIALAAKSRHGNLAAPSEREQLFNALVRRDATLEASRSSAASTANLSHEIRTPLNIILGYGELIAEQLEDLGCSELAPYLDAIQRAGYRLLHTVEEILDFSKLEAGALELKPVEIRLAPMLEEVVSDFRFLAAAKELKLICQIEAPNTHVRFDEHCLENALRSLLHNAVKFTESGFIAARLFHDAAGAVKIEIRDSGVGIDEAYLPRLYEPFSQEDSSYSRPFEGAGLGLALTRKYLQLNGASLEVRSTKNQGTICTIGFLTQALPAYPHPRNTADTKPSPTAMDSRLAAHHLQPALSYPGLERRR